MTIRPGEEWGTRVPRPPGLLVAHSDAELASLVDGDASLAVAAGDLHRVFGAPGDRAEMQRVPMDLLRVAADGRALRAVAHVVARRSWWRGPLLAVCNVDHIGDWLVAPRAHPNDGRFDVVEVAASMTLRDRWGARRRLPYGGHVPHPSISRRRDTRAAWTFDRPLRLWLDGVEAGTVEELTVELESDAYELHV